MALPPLDGGVERLEKKWGRAAIGAGFTVVPSHLLGINSFVLKEQRITPTEMVVLLQMLLAWWSAERMPFPSKNLISARTGLSPRQVQRAIASLEAKSYIQRIPRSSITGGRASNQYDLSGLSSLVSRIAEQNPAAFKKS